ncbi:hypothetical protein [Flectobacillus rivi]|uniref:Phage abortive infection protein n=1 Tax=Flectobacillus rivi TaxID=2984209 RepID=A0ABT6YYZ7_9BACT|nr:hypothetical protein [Flectobacillus rivi]MDI9874097.1 hypothetical protein [Flectobacillus rivi]
MESPVALIRKAIKSHQELSRFIMWIVVSFIILIFFVYPILIKFLFETLEGKESGDFNRGTFGDMYGALNAFLSGLAFIGAIVAIIIQIYQVNTEKRKHEEEIKVQLNLFKWHLQRLSTTYLPNLKYRLEIKRGSMSLRMFEINFHDDYSFRELENINILELYKGFILLGKKREADELISFFQQFKEIHDDYKSIEEFIRKNETELKEMENKMKSLKIKLCERLIANSRPDLAHEVNSSGFDYQYTGINENGETVLDPLLQRITEHFEYIDTIETFSRNEFVFNASKTDKITRVDSILILCNTLSDAIPNI